MKFSCHITREGAVSPTFTTQNTLKAVISAEEGRPAILHMTLSLEGVAPELVHEHTTVTFEDDRGILFGGKIAKTSVDRKRRLLSLTAIAHHEVRREDSMTVQCHIKESDHWDERFYGEGANISHMLTTTLQLPYWSRVDGRFSLSHLFEGRRHMRVDPNMIIGDYTRVRTHQPLGGVHVRLRAQWTQVQRGQKDLTETLRAAIPHGEIRTLTPDTVVGVVNALPTSVHNAGYYGIRSGCVEADVYAHERSIFCKEKGMAEVKAAPALIYVMQPELLMGWDIEVQREEVLHASLAHHYQGTAAQAAWKTLHYDYTPLAPEAMPQTWSRRQKYHLGTYVTHDESIFCCLHDHVSADVWSDDAHHWQSVSHDSYERSKQKRDSYFPTDEGKRTVAHALAMARGYLAFSARCEKIQFTLSFEDGRDMDCDTTVIIDDPLISGSPVRGKVSAYRMIINPQAHRACVEVDIMVAIGADGERPAALSCSYGFEDHDYTSTGGYDVPDITRMTSLERWDKHDPYTHEALARDILQGVEVTNTAAQQCALLERHSYPVMDNPFALLAHHPTIITMTIKNIPKKVWVKNAFTAEIATPWSAPQQMVCGG